ncbi:MAG: hypothetical protein ACRD8A_00755 [Candidatus Acidiferrales bacterium]
MKTILSLFLGLLLFATAGNARPVHARTASLANPRAASPLVSSWTTFGDPAEQAFTLEVPQGWKITGGLYRFGVLDPRFMVDMVSPDGKVDIRLGDYRVPPFAPLTPTLQSLGFTEGRRYSPRNVAQEVVANYREGWIFADLYGQARFSSACTHLNLKSMNKEEPVHPSGPNVTTTAGEALYTCESSGGPRVAYVFAETQYTQMQQSGAWMVSWLYSFIAPQSEADEALKTTLHALSTFVVSPQWYYRQLQINGQVGEDAMRDFHRGMDAIQQDYQRRSAASQSQFDEMSRALRGVDLTIDPVDGKQREVLSTGQTHWINGMGNIADSPTAPSGSHKLNTVQ